MMNTQFKIGDIVQLKSGGPSMKILAIFEHEKELKAQCVLIEGTKEAIFALESLVLVPNATIVTSSR
jgi:uncharacterized protein YodC (DUF2158 family)